MTVDALPGNARGFHPFGAADPAGFAAMACGEILVHAQDAATGLGEDFQPGPRLARDVLARLFPWHRLGQDVWAILLWAHGRLELSGTPPQRGWRWHSAPLAEWDGAPARQG